MKRTTLKHIRRPLARGLVLGAAALSLLPAAVAPARQASARDGGVRLACGEFLAAAVLAVVSARGVAHDGAAEAQAAPVSRPAPREGEVAPAPNNMTPSAGGKRLAMAHGMARQTRGNLLHRQITPN